MTGAAMEVAPKPKAKKATDIAVLHCLNPGCGGLLAYEVDSANVLYVDLAWTAHSTGGRQYFPCPKCGGKNFLAECRNEAGAPQHRVASWEP